MNHLVFSILVLWFGAALAAPAVDMDYVQTLKTGGETSIVIQGETIRAYRNPAANLTEQQIRQHLSGDALFEKNFSDDSTRFDYGLGPVYNNTNCNACHAKDGRGALPVILPGQEWVPLRQNESVFLRISIENGPAVKEKTAANHWGAPVPVPGFSDQLFHLGSLGLREDLPGTGQAQVFMKYEKTTFSYPDGKTVEMRKPVFKIENPYDLKLNSVTGKMESRLLAADVKTGARR